MGLVRSVRFSLRFSAGSPVEHRTRRARRALFACLAVALAGDAMAYAQQDGRAGDGSQFRALPNHVPYWAIPENSLGAIPAERAMGPMTLVLARHRDRQQALEKLLADQQDPGSGEYHHWLTPSQIGQRFGLSMEEIDSITGWLEAQGLHVDWVAPGRSFIGFSGSAGDVGRAFQAELNAYSVEGVRKFSVASAPKVPAELAPLIKAVTGLYTVEKRPLSQMHRVDSASPEITTPSGDHFITPTDFSTIYNLPGGGTGKGVSIGIVGRSRTNTADFDNFRSLVGPSFADPVEIVPTQFGGIDPGPPLTAPPTGSTSIGDQSEATLDVLRAASIASDARVLLVITTTSGGDIEADAQYLVQTEPVPAQIVNISFESCESNAGSSAVDFWNDLFQQAAGEGISVFVSSGDSGASGCDANFQTPPSDPPANSPNAICSSSYVTCVGGTEFDDSDASKYWSSSNGAEYGSASSYIPEGAWNEPFNSAATPAPQTASSGGGVSQYIGTPSWQKGTGVPAARAGRYTPDIAFSAAAHDGYFGCFAAGGGSCVSQSGSFSFLYFFGTSASAPDMAGIAALLDQEIGGPQGNLNPGLYSLAASTPKAFHDVTVATSGITSCSVSTPSMCNNSIPGPTGLTGGQAGYTVNAGYDEVTGLGSLDVESFINAYWSTLAPAATTGTATAIKATQATLAGTVKPNGVETHSWVLYGTSSSLKGAKQSASIAVGSQTTAMPVTVKLSGLTPGTKYYYEIQASNSGGTGSGKIAEFVTPKGNQTITFQQPDPITRYGAKPVALSAKASSGLPVSFSVVHGPAKVSGSTLTYTGAGTVVVAAKQAGNPSYVAAPEVQYSIDVRKAILTVRAQNLTMTKGGKVPALTYTVAGFVNGDTRAKATHGGPTLSTKATSSSSAGSYTISVSVGTLTSTNYAFEPVSGTLTVKP
jgi:subtilase family serine protease